MSRFSRKAISLMMVFVMFVAWYSLTQYQACAAETDRQNKEQREKLVKQREELQAFDEQLRHYADQQMQLDLDDGVKVNYLKFGDLLAEVKAVTGTSGD